MAFSRTDLVLSMFNPKITGLVKKNIKYIKDQYKEDDVLYPIIKLLDNDNPNQVTKVQVEAALYPLGITPIIKDRILACYDTAMDYTKDDIEAVYKLIQNSLAEYLVNIVASQSRTEPYEYIKAIKDLDTSSIDAVADEEIYSECLFGDFNISSMLEELHSKVFKSSFTLINEHYPLGGYFPRELIAVSGPPGSGKSMYLMNEAISFINQGYKVCYAAIGDLNNFDFVARMSSIIIGNDISSTCTSLEYSYRLAMQRLPDITKSLLVQFIGADKLSASEYVNLLRSKGYYDYYDVFIIDYDSNFKSDEEMYQKGTEVYNIAKNLANREGKLVFIGAQPKVFNWDVEVLPMSAIGESSRKQQIVDSVITMSHVSTPGGYNHIGILNLCKCRRGTTGSSYYFMDDTGKISEISQATYTYLKVDSTPYRRATDIPSRNN